MQWARYKEKYDISDEGHVYNRHRGTYLLPQKCGKHTSIGYKIDLYGAGHTNRRSVRSLVWTLFQKRVEPDETWVVRTRAQVQAWNEANGKTPQSKKAVKRQFYFQCDGCGRDCRMETRTKERIVQQHGCILCSYCRNKLHETGQEKPVYVTDPYPHLYVQGANDQECNGLILGLG